LLSENAGELISKKYNLSIRMYDKILETIKATTL